MLMSHDCENISSEANSGDMDSSHRMTIMFMTKNMNSGSYFLHSLLDGHSEIIVMPTVFNYDLIRNCHQRTYWSEAFLHEFVREHYRPMITEMSISKNERNGGESKKIVGRIEKSFSESVKKVIVVEMLERISKTPSEGNGFIQFLQHFAIVYAQQFLKLEALPRAVLVPLHFMLTDLKRPSHGNMYFEGSFIHLIKNNERAKLIHMSRDPRANYGSGVYSDNHGGEFLQTHSWRYTASTITA